jgi:hypothetical protein
VDWLVLAMALTTSACIGNRGLDFPEGLEPLEDNLADDPALGQLTTASGKDRPSWGHGRALYAAPSDELWQIFKDPATVTNTWTTDEQSVELDVNPAYDYSFLIHYTVDDILTVEWDEEYRFGIIDGDESAPAFGMIRYQMVYGSEFIDIIEGSYEIVRIDDARTEVLMVQHVQALSGGKDDIVDSFEHVHANILAALGQ